MSTDNAWQVLAGLSLHERLNGNATHSDLLKAEQTKTIYFIERHADVQHTHVKHTQSTLSCACPAHSHVHVQQTVKDINSPQE
jgi:hypothetical protein